MASSMVSASPIRIQEPLSNRLLTSTYVGTVAALAAYGFAGDFTAPILLAAALSLPASAIALPGYYLAYGLLAWATNANPSSASGSASCTAGGDCVATTTGDPALWFQLTTDALGIAALACAAILNVFLISKLAARRQARLAG